MKKWDRFIVPDVVKSIWILGIVLVHTTIYAFDGIYQMDFDNPPIVMIVFSVLTYWGALFTLVAGWLHTTSIYKRLKNGENLFNVTIKYSSVSALFLLIIHYLYNFVFGVIQLNFDITPGHHTYTIVTALLRNGNLQNLEWGRLVDGSTFSTVAFSIMIIGAYIYCLEKNEIAQKKSYWITYLLAFALLATSYFRVKWYPAVETAAENHNYFMQLIYSFILEKPYPLIPYLSFGFFGALIGYMQIKGISIKKVLLTVFSVPIIVMPLAFNLVTNNEISVAAIDWFGVGRLLIELSVFMIIIGIFISIFKFKKSTYPKSNLLMRTFQLISIYSVTIYMYQPTISEIMKKLVTLFNKEWSYSVNSTIWFGALNIFVWLGLVWIIQLLPKELTFEYWWNALYKKFGRDSEKFVLENE